MQNRILSLCMLVMFVFACKRATKKRHTEAIEVQGHRGDRGNFPENTIPAFISAVHKGVDVIELDVVISKDNKVVVSHEPYMSSQYVLAPGGVTIDGKDEKSFNLYLMDYDSIKKFDTGSKGNKSFPQQEKMTTYKPLLSEVIDSVENYIVRNKIEPVRYNIEIKSNSEEYDKSQPQPEMFVNLVMQVIDAKGIKDRINIQSFDPAILNVLHGQRPEIKTAFLTDKQGIDKNLSQLAFIPDIYSPHFKLVNQKFLDTAAAKKMRVIPWTLNNENNIEKMIALKVDGIITDYPERVIKRID